MENQNILLKALRIISITIIVAFIAWLIASITVSVSTLDRIETELQRADSGLQKAQKGLQETNARLDNVHNGLKNIHTELIRMDTNNSENTVELYEDTLEKTDNTETVGYIFIGDSRFVGMNNYCNIEENENNYVIAKVGEGYNFLINNAIQQAEEIEQENTDVEHWKYIICLGINDLGNIDKYIETYNELSLTKDLYLVSVNPIEYHSYITNDSVKSFNDQLKSIENIHYIDSYASLIENGFSTVDGIHYTNDTYDDIYNIITEII